VSTGTEDLLVNILRDMPRLPGAACRGRARQFELLPWDHPQRDEHAALAIAECKKCPALQPVPTRHSPRTLGAARSRPRWPLGSNAASGHNAISPRCSTRRVALL
jgi:hypothetical protein